MTTNLEAMLPPKRQTPSDVLAEMIELAAQRVSMLDAEELARAGAHEYDEEIVVPPPGSAGERFLREVARAFVRWTGRENRFPASGADEREVVAVLVGELAGGEVAHAYVDLGLYYSAHAAVAGGAEVEHLRAVLTEVAERIVVTLAGDYGPGV